MIKKRDLMSLQAESIHPSDLSVGFSWLVWLRTGNTNGAPMKPPHLLCLAVLLPGRGPGRDTGRAHAPGGFCEPA